MMSAWLLPEHIADVLPAQARQIEGLRATLLGLAQRYGFELVMPPLLEHLESLLSGTGESLGLKTFKLVDQLSGHTLGVRADTTPQAARIDAHLLNRQGVTRLCYCGPVLHTRPDRVHASREPLQFGVEIFGHVGLEADLESLDLALDALRAAGVQGLTLDLADARIVKALLNGQYVAAGQKADLMSALAAKDSAGLQAAAQGLPPSTVGALLALLKLYGGLGVLEQAREVLPAEPLIESALNDLARLAGHVANTQPGLALGIDLADLGGNSYYSGSRFAVYAAGGSDALLRGGRYDEVGAVFGRTRPAVGFSLDLKALAELLPAPARASAIRAPWGEDRALREAVRTLRDRGESVVCVLPGHEHEADEFDCDRELLWHEGAWRVLPLSRPKLGA
jgi:ATP phosphoribosyltransferase regulatory subunit